jgi:hypothetical protein
MPLLGAEIAKVTSNARLARNATRTDRRLDVRIVAASSASSGAFVGVLAGSSSIAHPSSVVVVVVVGAVVVVVIVGDRRFVVALVRQLDAARLVAPSVLDVPRHLVGRRLGDTLRGTLGWETHMYEKLQKDTAATSREFVSRKGVTSVALRQHHKSGTVRAAEQLTARSAVERAQAPIASDRLNWFRPILLCRQHGFAAAHNAIVPT